jgi:ATP-binding cassette subfamily B protein
MIPSYAEGVCPNCLHQRRILWRLFDVAKPYRASVLTALTLTFIHAFAMTLPPIFQKNLIDRGLAADTPAAMRMQQLLIWSAALVGIILLTEVMSGGRMALLSRVGTRVTADLRHMVYAHLHELSLRYFAKRRTGSLLTRVTNDTDRLWDFIVFGSVNFIRDITMIVAIAGVMFYMNWLLALISLLPLPIVGFLTYWRGRTMQRMFGRLWTYWSRLTGVVGDVLGGVRVVKAFASEDREIERFDRRNDDYTNREQAVNRVWWELQPMVSGIMRFGVLLVWVAGGYLLIRHPSPDNTLGTLVAFTAFVTQFYQPIMELASSNRMITRAATSAQRVFEVLDTPPEIYSKKNAITRPKVEGRVEFRNVSFSYEGAAPALREVSLVVEPGEMVGLCGPSGAGKSTLVNLIGRFYDATEGAILIDGVDVRDYDVRWLRKQIGVVLQEPYLFHGTIADNIRYGNPNATDADVIRAARAANAHDFIVGFPDGYDTTVGERGQSLSGGERQRISIARAILHDPRILILDEATSSVDSETEKQIQQALDRLVEGRTTFAIAHRLSTLQAASRLVVLQSGRIVETGTHAELVAREDGIYAKLHKTQMEAATRLAVSG